MVIRVTDRAGNPAMGAHVLAEGPSQRDGSTDALGTVTFRTMTSGTYRVRAEGEGFIALEKELLIRNTIAVNAEFALSPAPPPPVPPPTPAPAPPAPVAAAPPPPARPVYPPGEAKVLSIPDLAERSLSGREPVKTVAIGCSGASRAELMIVRENMPATASNTADQVMYLVAGEASLTLSGKEQVISPGWLSIVPHGTSYAMTRRGRNPLVFVSITAGEPCTGAAR
jgi:mannose-6-phosphate isomerase-like protein (cupin superfamily)